VEAACTLASVAGAPGRQTVPVAGDLAAQRPSLAAEAALAVAIATAFADSSIVVLALPELYSQLDTTIPGISWVVTAYNLAVVVVTPLLLPLVRRVAPARLAVSGLAVFLVASVSCAASQGLAPLVAGRAVQGVGAALLLAASLPLLAGLSGSRERGIAIWVGAGTVGTAVGPAVGGVLTRAFDWRAIFAVQAPVAAAAFAAALSPRVRALRPPDASMRRFGLVAGLGLLLLFAALVGALFLAVLLVVTVWGLGPLAGAGVVSALPVAALAARPVASRLPVATSVAGGCGLLAAGLAALAFLPATSPALAALALAIGGAGLGLALPPLTRASLGGGDPAGSGVISVGVRHLGLVVGLVAVAPLLATGLQHGGDRATLNATAAILDARLPLREKIPIAVGLYRAFQQTPDGEIPDLGRPFDARGADDDVRAARDALLEAVRAPLTRGFRPSFAVAAGFALLGAATALAFRRRPAP
jgi:predicted MFS family arabinose efflux permease